MRRSVYIGSFYPRAAPQQIGVCPYVTSRHNTHRAVRAPERGESGRAYLVGDQNLSWKAHLELWCEAVGNPQDLEVRDDDHPMFPNVIMFAGSGATVSY